jgi:hypothetical protein
VLSSKRADVSALADVVSLLRDVVEALQATSRLFRDVVLVLVAVVSVWLESVSSLRDDLPE